LAADVDDYAMRWAAAHRDACTAHQRGEQSADLLDRRMLCLHRGRSRLASLAGIARDVQADELTDFAIAAQTLPDPEDCSDLDRVQTVGKPLPPGGSALAERVEQLHVLFEAGRHHDAVALGPQLVEDARALGHEGLLAEALHRYAVTLLEQRAEAAPAMELLAEATRLALVAGDDELAMSAWSNRAWASATGHAPPAADAFDGIDVMIALAERHSDHPTAVAFYSTLGSAEIGRGHREVARERLQRAVELGEVQGERASRHYPQAVFNLALVIDDPQEREQMARRAAALFVEMSGAEHPRTLMARGLEGAMETDAHRAFAVFAGVCRDLWTFHPRRNDELEECEYELVNVAEFLGDRDAAAMSLDRLLRLPHLSREKLIHAKAALSSGDPAGAAALVEALVPTTGPSASDGQPFWVQSDDAEAELVLGRAWRELDDPRADAMLRRALARFELAAQGQATPIQLRRVEVARKLVEKGGNR
jgi:tetratricopeptide (TPR) repeat protein